MGRICPPLFRDMSKSEIQAELEKVNAKINDTKGTLQKLEADKKELTEALKTK